MVFLQLWWFGFWFCFGVWLVFFLLLLFFPREFALLFKPSPRRGRRQQSPAEHLRSRGFSLQEHLRWEKPTLKIVP